MCVRRQGGHVEKGKRFLKKETTPTTRQFCTLLILFFNCNAFAYATCCIDEEHLSIHDGNMLPHY